MKLSLPLLARPAAQKSFPEEITIGDGLGEDVSLSLRVNRQAKHIFLKMENNGQPVLVLPAQRHLPSARKFAAEKLPWLRARLQNLPPWIRFDPGAVIPVLGQSHEIQHEPDRRAGVERQQGRLLVSGREEHVNRRVQDWLRQQAKIEYRRRATGFAAELALSCPKITVRDPATRWGSCSASGELSLSWRLMLAPVEVMNYVIAHEVCHLREHNHSRAFWALVKQLDADYRRSEKWLSANSSRLHRYG